MSDREQILNAIKEGNIFDFVANNAYGWDKHDLIDLTKELAYALHRSVEGAADPYDILQDELSQRWGMGEYE